MLIERVSRYIAVYWYWLIVDEIKYIFCDSIITRGLLQHSSDLCTTFIVWRRQLHIRQTPAYVTAAAIISKCQCRFSLRRSLAIRVCPVWEIGKQIHCEWIVCSSFWQCSGLSTCLYTLLYLWVCVFPMCVGLDNITQCSGLIDWVGGKFTVCEL